MSNIAWLANKLSQKHIAQATGRHLDSLSDRLTHHAQILLFQGESYRFRESRQQHKEV